MQQPSNMSLSYTLRDHTLRVIVYTLRVFKPLGCSPYPEKRVFLSIARQWKQKHPGVGVKFYIYHSAFQPTLRELIKLYPTGFRNP